MPFTPRKQIRRARSLRRAKGYRIVRVHNDDLYKYPVKVLDMILLALEGKLS